MTTSGLSTIRRHKTEIRVSTVHSSELDVEGEV